MLSNGPYDTTSHLMRVTKCGRMWLSSVLAALALLISSPAHGTARNYPSPRQLSLIHAVQDHLHNEEFALADSLSTELKRLYPHDPAGYLLAAVVAVTEMYDAEENSREAYLRNSLDSAYALASTALDSCPSQSKRYRAWMQLYRGHVHAYRSLWEVKFGSKFTGMKQGRAAKAEYERGLGIDSSLYDLYFGLGLYHYWKSAKAGLLRRLGLVKNDKEKGITQLRHAADSSLISRQSARSALIWIWLDSEEYDSVVTYCQRLRTRYPNGRSFLWPLAQAQYKMKLYQEAAATYELLRRRLEIRPGNYYNLIECDYQLYQAYKKMDDNQRARQMARQVSQYASEVPFDTRHRQKSKIGYLVNRAD